MKHKNRIIFIGLLIFANSLFAENVPIERARQIAKNAYYEKVSEFVDINYENIIFSDEISISYKSLPMYYVFNLNQSNGYIIISAEDHVVPVLAYSYEGSYNSDNLAPGFIEWMETYSKQIYYVIQHKTPSTTEIEEAWDYYLAKTTNTNLSNSKNVGPLATTTWDQSEYYNSACPVSSAGPGGHVLTGCVATCMAQLLRYHKYPKVGSSSSSYNAGSYGNLSANYGSTTYKYSNMPEQLSSENADVALLMFHCGVSVEMNYSPYGSGASSSDAATALMTYFNYSTSTFYAMKSDYSELKWKILIRADIINKRPLMYRGTGSGGHSFLCDGFQYPDHFHFNWGWGGSANGYFYLSSLNPSGGNFTYDQGAICNAIPSSSSSSPAGIDESEFSKSINLFPNPTDGIFNLEIDNNSYENISLTIIDLTGRNLKKIELNKTNNYFSEEINVSDLKAGYYLISIETKDNIAIKRFIKN